MVAHRKTECREEKKIYTETPRAAVSANEVDVDKWYVSPRETRARTASAETPRRYLPGERALSQADRVFDSLLLAYKRRYTQLHSK